MGKPKRMTILAGTSLLVLAMSPAQGQSVAEPVDPAAAEVNEDIIVTATRTGETRLQSTPIAVTAVSSDALDRTGTDDIRDLVQLVPNLQVAQNAGFSQVYIRGIGSNNVFAGSDPSSTMHLDGIYIARPAANLTNFLDVERVEVLRGPQGTLYGRNSVGGTINVISRRPGNDFEAKAQLTVGNYDFYRAEGYVSGPIVEDLVAASLSIVRSKRDGYIRNIAIAGDRVDDEDYYAARAQLRLTPTPGLEYIVRGDYFKADEALAGYVKLLVPSPTDPIVNTTLGNYRRVALNLPSSTDREIWGVSGEGHYELAPWATLTSLTAYRSSELNASNDTDATAVNVRRTRQFEGQNQFSQEFNISGSTPRIRYVAGIYYFQEEIEADSPVTNFGPMTEGRPNPLVNTEAWAAYGQLTYYIADGLGLTAGIRYTEEQKDFTQRFSVINLVTGAFLPNYPLTYSLSDTYKAWTPKFGIEWQASEQVFLYASATRGFKSGGFNFSSQNRLQGFDPEFLWSYEAGFRTDLLDRRLRINATAFLYDYSDLQVQSFITPGVVDITNAADARVKGIEIELLARPLRGLSFGGNLAYLDAQYVNYSNALLPGNIPFDASGNRLNSAPKWAFNMFGQYDHSLASGATLFLRAEYNWRGRQYYSPQNLIAESQEGFALVNASAGYIGRDDRWRVSLFVRNLFDEEYVTTTATFTGPVSGRVGEPRTAGVRLAISY